MSISRLEHTLIRRSLLIILVIPISALLISIELIKAFSYCLTDALVDLSAAVSQAWRGK